MKGFLNFVREQGVVGLAVGIILGGAVSKIVTSIVNDLLNPLLGIILGASGSLTEKVFIFGNVQIKWGNFVNSLIDFLAISFVVYILVKMLRLDRLDKKKEIK